VTWGLLNSTLFKMCIFINFQYVLLHDLKKQNLFMHVVLINPILSMRKDYEKPKIYTILRHTVILRFRLSFKKISHSRYQYTT
jgi:hypothetical protein